MAPKFTPNQLTVLRLAQELAGDRWSVDELIYLARLIGCDEQAVEFAAWIEHDFQRSRLAALEVSTAPTSEVDQAELERMLSLLDQVGGRPVGSDHLDAFGVARASVPDHAKRERTTADGSPAPLRLVIKR
jgi:hypothetical protein